MYTETHAEPFLLHVFKILLQCRHTPAADLLMRPSSGAFSRLVLLISALGFSTVFL